jgi:membrane peptidoglycan carboxypeptidase
MHYTIEDGIDYSKKTQSSDARRFWFYNLGLLEHYRAFKLTKTKLATVDFDLRAFNLSTLIKSIRKFPQALLEMLWLGLFFWLGFIFKSTPTTIRNALPTSLMGWAKFSLLGILLFGVLAIAGLFTYLSYEVDAKILQQYIQTHQFRTAVAMRDPQGHLIGALPSPKTAPNDKLNQQQRQGALYVDEVPAVFWDVLTAREDRGLDFDFKNTSLLDILTGEKASYKGINFASLLKRPIESQLKGNDLAGGSALINLIIKNLYGIRYFNQTNTSLPLLSSLQRKLEELRGARHLFPYLAKHNGEEFKRWIAMHAPLLSAGDDVYGIRSAAATLFGQRPQDLSDAEQAVLAAAYHRGVRFQPLSKDAKPELHQARLNRWEKLIEKAKKGVENAYQTSHPEKMRAILTALDGMITPQIPKVPASLSKILAKLSFVERQRYGNLKQRADMLVSSLKPRIVQRLKQQDALLSANEMITDIKITLPVGVNHQFKDNLNKTFAQIRRDCPSCYNKAIGLPANNESNGALIRVVVANEQGGIVRYYRRGFPQRRPIASVSKIVASVLLASKGVTTEQRFCNKAFAGRKNASGLYPKGVELCDKPELAGHAYRFIDTIAQSKNLPLYHQLVEQQKFSTAHLLQLYKDFGLKDSKTLNGKPPQASQLAFELSFGLAEATPKQVHRIIQALTQQLYQPSHQQEPHVIKSLRISAFKQGMQQAVTKDKDLKYPSQLDAIKTYLNKDEVKQVLRRVLASPVNHNKGTLNRFKRIHGAKFLIAKSGTSETPHGITRDKWAVGSFSLQGKIYTFTILVGTDDLENGLGNSVTHNRVIYPIMREIVASLRK